MLNVQTRKPASRLALCLASIAVAIAIIFAMAFSAPMTAQAKPADDLQAAQITPSVQKAATVLVYLNGSDLESEAGEASADIDEMLASGIGENANVVIQTLGTKKWQDHGIASDHTQRYIVDQGELKLVDDSLGQLDTTAPDTLADFISWGVQNYPADRYMLVMWDHGAGPVYGFGYDEFQSEESALTLDEMRDALTANANVHFDFIGMDCCIMSSLETYYVLAPFCDYAILSEDFEPGVGWSYKNWMATLESNPTVDTKELGTAIVDDMINDIAKDPENGEATLALVDESVVPALYDAWIAFAYENKDALLNTNYSQEVSQHGRNGFEADSVESMRPGHGGFGSMGAGEGPSSHGSHSANGNSAGNAFDNLYGYFNEDSYNCEDCYDSYDDYGYYDGYDYYGWEGCEDGSCAFADWDYDGSYVTMSDYFVTDIMVAASSADSDKAAALEQALGNAIVHFNSTSGETGMTGIGVTLPYGDAEFYDQLVDVFTDCGIDADYIAWLEDFVDAEGANSYYDFGEFEDEWSGWDDYSYGRQDPYASSFAPGHVGSNWGGRPEQR